MVVAKRQGREKPMKIEQRKVRGPEWGPQVEQITPLAGPIYIRQAQGEGEKTYKKSSQRAGAGSLLFESFGSACPHASWMYFPLFSKLNWAVTQSCNTDLSKSWDTPRALTSVTSNFCCDKTEQRKLCTPNNFDRIGSAEESETGLGERYSLGIGTKS